MAWLLVFVVDVLPGHAALLTSSFYFPSVVQIGWFIFLYFPGHWHFLCPLHCSVEAIFWLLKIVVVVVFSSKISIYFFFISSISWLRFYIFIYFKLVHNAYWRMIITAAFKFLSDNSNIWVMFLESVNCLFSFMVQLFWFLLWCRLLKNLLYPGHFGHCAESCWIQFCLLF